jgi:hypothetical protein
MTSDLIHPYRTYARGAVNETFSKRQTLISINNPEPRVRGIIKVHTMVPILAAVLDSLHIFLLHFNSRLPQLL